MNDQARSRKHVEEKRRESTMFLDALPLCLLITLLLLVLGCSHRPPADFAPDPGLVQRITQIRIDAPSAACPGQSFLASYTAVLNDGSLVPFENRYDKDHPPRLHIVFLDRTSNAATPLENGAWTADRDPLLTVTTGFHLTVVLRQKSSLQATATLAPEYSCLPHAFGFQGAPGDRGGAGGDGPDVTVRLGIVRSPYVERLLVAGIEISNAPPFFTVADANVVPPRDWLLIESRGGQGGRGRKGSPGTPGQDAPSRDMCPGSNGGPGSPGGRGADGGPGGRGGRITIIVPTEVPFLAGLVDAHTPGGPGGEGGVGGDGGAGGRHGVVTNCDRPGMNGVAGEKGAPGGRGGDGPEGLRPQVITVPARDVFGTQIPPGLADLLGASAPPAPPRRP